MRVFVPILLASALAACSGSQDFCARFTPVINAQENQISECPSTDAGSNMAASVAALDVVGGEFPFSVAGCAARISGCGANDLSKLDNELSCIQQLKPFDCSVLGEDPDAGLLDFANSVGNCQAQHLSTTCQVQDGGLGCGVEQHTNTNQSNPLPLGFQTAIPDCLGIINGVPDTHYFELNAPPPTTGDAGNAAGGYFQVAFSDITANVQGQLTVTLNDTTGSQLYNASYSFDSPSTLFLAAAAGTSFLVEVSADSQLPLGYTVLASFTGIDDPYKPDSQMSVAKSLSPVPITSGGATTNYSYYWAGQRSAEVLIPTFKGDFDDWFSFQLMTGGTVELKLEQFPYDFAPEVDFLDGSGTLILPQPPNPSSSITDGAIIDYTALAPTGGTYYAHVFAKEVDGLTYATYSTSPLSSSAILPPHFLQPYTLTVTFSE